MLKLGLPSRTCEQVPNRFNRLRKILKLYQHISQKIRNPKKWRSISSLDLRETAKTMQRVY